MAPSGLATVMFTDLEASTDTTTRLGDDAAAALFAAHDRIVREQLAAHGGRNARSTGDGFLVLFDSARSAVACALAIQRELAAGEEGVRVRIGLNAGEVQEGEDGALFGAAINLASRVMDRADGGEILVTDTVRQLVGTMPDARFRERGRVALKGFPERQRLHEAQPAAGGSRLARHRKRARRSSPAAPAAGSGGRGRRGGGRAGRHARRRGRRRRPEQRGRARPRGRAGGRAGPGRRAPADLAVAGGSVWVGNQGDNTVTRIGARSRRVIGTDRPASTSTGSAPVPAASGWPTTSAGWPA